MNSIQFFVLAALPLLAFAALSPESSQLYGCDVLKYPETHYYNDADNALGVRGRGTVANNFDDCVGICLSTPQCIAVNFALNAAEVEGKTVNLCLPFRSGLSDPNIATQARYNRDEGPNKYTPDSSYTHGYIKKCPDLTATGPVGCGKQANTYKPKFTTLNRIIGGTVANPHSWPWQVSLFSRVTATATSGFGCGSSLVRVHPTREESDILVTAAHCIVKEGTKIPYPPSQVTATAGIHNSSAPYELGKQVRTASNISMKSDYDPIFNGNDIAIVKLDKPIKFSDTIRPICLPDASEEIPAEKFCAVTGWGRDRKIDQVSSSDVLKQLALPVHSAETCGSREVWSSNYNAEQMICAGDLQANEGMCKGDSGGMLACQQTNAYDPNGGWKLYGAASFVSSERADIVTCLRKNKPGVFARVSKYRQWIDDTIKELTSVK